MGYEEEVCSTKYEKKCEQLTKRQCYTDYRDVPYQDEECNDNYVRECPQIWEEDGKIKRPKSVRMFLINIVKMFTDADLNKSPEGSLSWFATMALTKPSPTKK